MQALCPSWTLASLKELWASSPSLDSCCASWLQEAQKPNKATVEMLEVSTEPALQSTLCPVGPREAACRGCAWEWRRQPWGRVHCGCSLCPLGCTRKPAVIWPVPAGTAGCMTGRLVCPSSQVLTKFLLLALLCVCFAHWCGHVHAHYAVHELFSEKLEINVLRANTITACLSLKSARLWMHKKYFAFKCKELCTPSPLCTFCFVGRLVLLCLTLIRTPWKKLWFGCMKV